MTNEIKNLNNKKYTKVHHHAFYDKLLSKNGWILDLGCNDFIFSQYFVDLGMKVIGLDPIKDIFIPQNLVENKNFYYLKKACVASEDIKEMLYYEYQSFGANSLYNTPKMLHRSINGGHKNNPFKNKYLVETTTIKKIMLEYNIQQFDLIKIDIEGAEYDILNNWTKKCSKQMCVEFHDFLHLNPEKKPQDYHKNIREKLSDYFVAYENLTPMDSESRVEDVLFVLKEFS